MSKATVMGVAALVAAGSLGIAAPASAQDCLGATGPLPPLETVYTENGQLRINPNGVGSDVERYSGHALEEWVETRDCVYGYVPEQVWCAYELVWFGIIFGESGPYAYQDPYTSEIVVDYGRLQNDLNDCT